MAAQRAGTYPAVEVSWLGEGYAPLGAPAPDPEARRQREAEQTRRRSFRLPRICNELDGSRHAGTYQRFPRARLSARGFYQYAGHARMERRNRTGDIFSGRTGRAVFG